MLDTIQQYIGIIGGIIGIVSSSVGLMGKYEGTSGQPYNKVLKFIIAISLIGLLTGTFLSVSTIAKADTVKKEYFKGKDPFLQYQYEANQKFDKYFNEEYVKPPMQITGVSIIVLGLAFLIGSFSKPSPSILEFILEMLWILLGVWLLLVT